MIVTLHDLNARGPVKAPRHAVVKQLVIPPWRWASLLAVFAAFLHYKAHARVHGPMIEDVIAATGTSLQPVSSTFAVWGPLLLVLLGYAMFQLVEDQRIVQVYDRVSRHVVALAALSSLQLVTIDSGIYVAAPIAIGFAAIAADAYRRVHEEIVAERTRPWVSIPFGLVLGYGVAIALPAADAMITAAGCPSSAPGIALAVGAGIAAVNAGMRYRDPILPGFVAWAFLAIAASGPAKVATLHATLLIGAACAAVAILIAAIRLDTIFGSSPSQHTKPTTRDRRPTRPTPTSAYGSARHRMQRGSLAATALRARFR